MPTQACFVFYPNFYYDFIHPQIPQIDIHASMPLILPHNMVLVKGTEYYIHFHFNP